MGLNDRGLIKNWLAFSALCLGMFMAILDIQIVSTSLFEIQQALHLERSSLSWIQTSYLIAEVIAVSITGIATRAVGIRSLFCFAIVSFSIASFACGLSHDCSSLILFRIIQGLSGGILIPLVFTSVFLFFNHEKQVIPTTIAGMLAVLAPTLGPLIGGWITDHYGWPWLFFINLPFGMIALSVAFTLLPKSEFRPNLIRRADIYCLFLIAVGLASLEIALKEAPLQGWASVTPLALFLLSAISITLAFQSLLRNDNIQFLQLKQLNSSSFILSSVLSFCLGVSLYGAVYLMPMFLGFVRSHSAFQIGLITLVTGMAQLITAPIAVLLERRFSAKILSLIGYIILTIGVASSTSQTASTDYDAMFWPQIIRGAGFMLCLIAPTRIALEKLKPEFISDGSAVFNLLRNLGGAVGLAVIDTILFGRGPEIGKTLIERLQSGDGSAAQELGIPIGIFNNALRNGLTPELESMLKLAVEKTSFIQAVNEAWIMLTIVTVFGALCSALMVRK